MFSCINQIEVFTIADTSLVVDGIITNEPGQQVRIYHTAAYNTKLKFEEIETAVVKIVDDIGNEELLTYSGDGFFVSSPTFAGVVGRSYQLRFVLESGKEYASRPEVMKSVPLIDSVRYQQVGTAMVFSIDFQDTPGEKNYYKWKHSETFEIIAPIAYEIAMGGGTLPTRDCFSGPRPINFTKLWRCWSMVADNDPINLENDQFFNGRQMTAHPIFSKEIDYRFNGGYYVEVRQYSLTKEAFDFWSAIETQIGNTGTIFETSNYQIRGNLYSVDNEDDLVLGYFGASAISRKSAFTYDYIGAFEPMLCETNNNGCYPERCMNCLKYSTSSTNVKPDYWPIE